MLGDFPFLSKTRVEIPITEALKRALFRRNCHKVAQILGKYANPGKS